MEVRYQFKGSIYSNGCSLFRYGVEKLGVTQYEAKIKCDNVASIQLFQQRLAFREVSRSLVFNEVTLQLEVVEPEIVQRLVSLAPWNLLVEDTVS